MECLFEKHGFTPKRKIMIPVRDINGIPQNKFLEVTENGTLHHKILLICGGKLPTYLKEINNKTEEP